MWVEAGVFRYLGTYLKLQIGCQNCSSNNSAPEVELLSLLNILLLDGAILPSERGGRRGWQTQGEAGSCLVAAVGCLGLAQRLSWLGLPSTATPEPVPLCLHEVSGVLLWQY